MICDNCGTENNIKNNATIVKCSHCRRYYNVSKDLVNNKTEKEALEKLKG